MNEELNSKLPGLLLERKITGLFLDSREEENIDRLPFQYYMGTNIQSNHRNPSSRGLNFNKFTV
jgi:hypothetical protein